MLFDALNMAGFQSRANKSGRSAETTRRLTNIRLWGASRARNTISSGVSMLAGLVEMKAKYGEIPRHNSGIGTRSFDNLQDKSNIVRRYAATEVTNGEKYRENIGIYDNFYNVKSIQPSNLFAVEFGWGNAVQKTQTQEEKQLSEAYGNMPKLEPWHVKTVSVDVLPAPVKIEKSFTYAFPVVDIQEMTHKFTVTLQEDKIGTVFNFIQWAYSRIISPSGVHYSQMNNRIGYCRVSILNPYTLVLTEFLYQDVFITSANNLSLDYASDSVIEYTVDFCATSKIVKTIDIQRKSESELNNEASTASNTLIGLFKSRVNVEGIY